ncbi:MAG: serine/threonine protein kinase [Polyangiaceae bacterium]|nr:serine/threonine protein kinase [Polyangiaceae bacterium]
MGPPRGLSRSASFGAPARGDLIAGRYRVERKLGAGGMGVVVAARDEQLGTRVAVKLVLPEGVSPAFASQDDSGIIARSNRHIEMSTRLIREASAASRLSSEHATKVLDVGRLEHGDPFVVMEMLEGVDLGRHVKERGPLPIFDTVNFVLQACEAIAEAHALGIIHRDLKPANLFLTRRADGSAFVKVLDFGISKVLGGDDNQLTATSDMLGSPLYMAPEQIRNARDVDARADVWSLGTILYRLLAGRAAFESDGAAATLAAIIGDPPESLRAIRPDVPADLEAIIFSCLEKDRNRRLQSVRDLVAALQRFLAVQSGQVIAVPLPSPPAWPTVSTTGSVSTAPNAVTVTGTQRRPATVALVTVGLALALLLGGIVAWRVTSSSAAAASGPAQSAETPSTQPPATAPTTAAPSSTVAPPAATSAAPAVSATMASTVEPAPTVTASTGTPPVKPTVKPRPKPADDPLSDRY